MKKNYVSPTAEKVEFNYSEQVVAASGTKSCTMVSNYTTITTDCTEYYTETAHT